MQEEIKNNKEAYRLFWLVKGHLNTSHETVISSQNGYFKRLWGNCERAEYGMEGFEEAFQKLLDKYK